MQAMMHTDTVAHRTPAAGFSAGAGRTLSALATLFLVFDSTIKLIAIQPVIDASIRLGYRPESMFGIGVILLLCVAVYVIPRTSRIGAVLLTGYLGGAIATHVRAGSTWFETLFPVGVAAFVWGGLVLRDAQLRAILVSPVVR